MRERGFGRREGVQDLSNGDMRTCADVAEGGLALGGGEVEKNFLFIRRVGVFGEEAEELLGGWIALDVRAPGQELTTGCDEFAGFLVAPYCWPATTFRLKEDLLISSVLWDG